MGLKAISLIFLSLVSSCISVTYERCELANLLLNTFNLPKEHISDWVCLARHESEYNSTAIGTLNADGSKDLGIFQISEKWWCEWGKRGKACVVQCEDLIDNDLKDDIKCAKRIFRVHGFDAWVAWKTKCQGDLSQYIAGCDLSPNVKPAISSLMKPGIIAKYPFVKRL